MRVEGEQFKKKGAGLKKRRDRIEQTYKVAEPRLPWDGRQAKRDNAQKRLNEKKRACG